VLSTVLGGVSGVCIHLVAVCACSGPWDTDTHAHTERPQTCLLGQCTGVLEEAISAVESWRVGVSTEEGSSDTGDLEELAGQRRWGDGRRLPGALTPLLCVDCTDCSLAEEHVLMRSVSLLGAVWRCVCRWRESLSPGKVKEPGRLAGEAGMELQKEPPFCRGLLGGKGSFPKGEGKAVERGEFSGEMVPGLGLPRGSGPRLPRASLAFPSWLVPEALPVAFLGLSITFILGMGSASC
jgi:hypothetical protein